MFELILLAVHRITIGAAKTRLKMLLRSKP